MSNTENRGLPQTASAFKQLQSLVDTLTTTRNREDAALYSVDIPTLGTLLSGTTTMVLQGLFGVLAGFACVSVMALVERFRR